VSPPLPLCFDGWGGPSRTDTRRPFVVWGRPPPPPGIGGGPPPFFSRVLGVKYPPLCIFFFLGIWGYPVFSPKEGFVFFWFFFGGPFPPQGPLGFFGVFGPLGLGKAPILAVWPNLFPGVGPWGF